MSSKIEQLGVEVLRQGGGLVRVSQLGVEVLRQGGAIRVHQLGVEVLRSVAGPAPPPPTAQQVGSFVIFG